MSKGKYIFAVGHVTSGAFAGYNSEAWCYIHADTPEQAWYAHKKKWETMVFPLEDFKRAMPEAEGEGAPSRNGLFIQAKRYV